MVYSDDTEVTRRRISLASGRTSDIRPTSLAVDDDTETTFAFTVPQRDTQDDEHSDSAAESPVEDDSVEDDVYDEVDGIDVEGLETDQNSHKESAVHILMQDTAIQDMNVAGGQKGRTPRKRVKVSKHGIQYPSLPSGVIKKLATTFSRTGGNSKAKISKDTLEAIVQASDWFFEQVSDDLDAYATHARRKTIDESDVVTLMARYESLMNDEAKRRLIRTCVQTTTDKYQHNAFFSCPNIPASRASTRTEDGSSIEIEQ